MACGTRAFRPAAAMRNPIVSPSPTGSTVSWPPRGIDWPAISSMLSRSFTRFFGSSSRGRFQASLVFSSSIRPRLTFSASPVSIWAPAEPAAPKASRQNCSLAEAVRALFLIRSMAKVLVSSSFASSITSSPLAIAPTGLIRSWQTREHRSAARSRDSSTIGPDMKVSGLMRWQNEALGDSGPEGEIMVTVDIAEPRLIEGLSLIATRAGAAILAVHDPAASWRIKPDQSPVTAADEAAEAVILEGLAGLLPGVPVVSEEAATKHPPGALGEEFLLVDPLDGTRELLAGEREYTVNIALVRANSPVAGVIAAPALGLLWRGVAGQRAQRLRFAPDAPATGEATAIRTRKRPERGAVA